MGTINAALSSAASTMDALQYALNVSENNIDNSSTPGYATQKATLLANPFDPLAGLSGGVSSGPMQDTRDLLAESEVWLQQGASGSSSAQSEALTALQNALPTAPGTGITQALTNFFNAASAWSTNPQDESGRQAVMDAAQSLAQSFNATSAAVANVSQSVTQGISSSVSQINSLTAQLAQYNANVINGGQHDAGLSAQIYNTLQILSGMVNIQVLPQQDGTVEVTLSGGEALVMGSQQYALTAGSAAPPANPVVDAAAPPHAVIYGADGADVTSQINSGTLAGQLQVRNVVIPSITGDAGQQGSLNELASSIATAVNNIVSNGSVSNGVAAASGLFTVDPNHADSAAATLAVDPNMTAAGLPAIDQNGVSNGVPLDLAAMASSPEISGASFTAYYGDLTASVGSQLNQAQSNQTLASQSLAQAESMRQTAEGVDLNTEAVNVLQLQEGFQAAAKLVSTLDTLTQSLLDMVPSGG
ncbi:MAG TPA: flagellar hook-associated protein FlgK [Bryobacteraceae bacterium]|nr:flagellar hook-associated protein FlgK [Bryobacteraceae bacterium]